MSFEIRVNNEPFTLWETASVRRSIDSNCGVFNFTSSVTTPPVDYPVKAGDFVQILINRKPRVTGFVDVINANQTTGNHHINVGGRDNVQDLIDSSIPDNVKNLEGPISMQGLCEQIIKGIGAEIPVINQSNVSSEFSKDTQFNAGSGQTAMDYLVSFMRKKQVYLITDGKGRLVIFRPTGDVAETALEHSGSSNDNVLSYNVTWDHQQLFNKYITRSQDNFGFDSGSDYKTGEGTNRTGEVIDDDIRASRYLELQTEQTLEQEEIPDRAKEEANVRRARAVQYIATVQGVAQEDGVLWDIGQLVKIQDDFAGVRGTMLIRSIENKISIDGGTTSVLTFALPDAYTVQGAPNKASERRANRGSRFENINPSRKQRFTR